MLFDEELGLTDDDACEIAEMVMDSLEDNEEKEDNDDFYDEDDDEDLNKKDEQYESLLKKYEGDHRKAIFEYCFIKNIYYSDAIYKKIAKAEQKVLDEGMPKLYLDIIAADPRYKDVHFFDQLMLDNFEKVYSEKVYSDGLTEDDRKNRQVVIDIFSYDPFKDEKENMRPQMYRDLAGMTTEAMRKDVSKQKAAISVVRSYGNIEKYQRMVNDIIDAGATDEDSQDQLNSYLKIISNIQASINQTAEKNSFTVKGIGSNGQGMISDILNEIEDKGIDEGITNFYDIATSKSIEEVANISMKAQLNQINLSKTDYADILAGQVEIVKKAQRIAKDAQEALRLAKEKIKKQRLIDELAADYRKKGISEKDIEDFISSEYHLQDGLD